MFLGHFDVAQLSVILDHSGIFWVGLALQVLELEVSTLLLFRAALEQPNAMLNLIVLTGHAAHTAHTHTVHAAHAAHSEHTSSAMSAMKWPDPCPIQDSFLQQTDAFCKDLTY